MTWASGDHEKPCKPILGASQPEPQPAASSRIAEAGGTAVAEPLLFGIRAPAAQTAAPEKQLRPLGRMISAKHPLYMV